LQGGGDFKRQGMLVGIKVTRGEFLKEMSGPLQLPLSFTFWLP
jgi:hypothetical protein